MQEILRHRDHPNEQQREQMRIARIRSETQPPITDTETQREINRRLHEWEIARQIDGGEHHPVKGLDIAVGRVLHSVNRGFLHYLELRETVIFRARSIKLEYQHYYGQPGKRLRHYFANAEQSPLGSGDEPPEPVEDVGQEHQGKSIEPG